MTQPNFTNPTPSFDASAERMVLPLAGALADVFAGGDDPAARVLGALFAPNIGHGEAVAAFDDTRALLSGNVLGVECVRQLEVLHARTAPEAWTQELGRAAEATMALLVQKKYQPGSRHAIFAREKIVTFTACTAWPSATTSPFPLDVVVWLPSEARGEFIEVKKWFSTYGRDKKFHRKLRRLAEFATALQARAGVASWVGVASIFEDPEVSRNMWTTMLGALAERTPEVEKLELLTRDSFARWFSQRDRSSGSRCR